MDVTARIRDAAEKAQQEFWARLAEQFPEIKTGDFPPDADAVFSNACIAAASVWVCGNMPAQGLDPDPVDQPSRPSRP